MKPVQLYVVTIRRKDGRSKARIYGVWEGKVKAEAVAEKLRRRRNSMDHEIRVVKKAA